MARDINGIGELSTKADDAGAGAATSATNATTTIDSASSSSSAFKLTAMPTEVSGAMLALETVSDRSAQLIAGSSIVMRLFGNLDSAIRHIRSKRNTASNSS
jgi:hypothetical protein